MEKKKILEYRERLDTTLASNDLVNEDSIKTLVKNQFLRSSPSSTQGHIENLVEKRTNEVSVILDMLRSTSENDSGPKTNAMSHRDWKLKHDSEEYRVMYREGSKGTPFHTLLGEGYVDGPLDVCLCLSWESQLFPRWWPQFNFPPFKITASSCLQRIRTGEQIIFLRVKVPWPVSAREVILHYSILEYFEDDLIIVLLNTISDTEAVDEHTHGFTRDCIPDVKDIVRIDLVGGFVLQKVTSSRSYFRTIATMDMKLDFIPPSLINFVSRQIIGSGFKLYQKAVASVAKGDEEFGKALKDPLYVRVRECLNDKKKLEKPMELELLESEKSAGISLQRLAIDISLVEAKTVDQEPLYDSDAIESSEASAPIVSQISTSEIKEEDMEEHTRVKEKGKTLPLPFNNLTLDNRTKGKKVSISSQVEHALHTLDDAISMVRKRGFGIQTWSGLGPINQELQNLERIAVEVGSTSSEDNSDVALCITPPLENTDKASDEAENASDGLHTRHNKQDPPTKEVKHNQIKPASPILHSAISNGTEENDRISSQNGKIEAPVLENMSNIHEEVTTVNGSHKNDLNSGGKIQKKKHRICCLHFYSSSK